LKDEEDGNLKTGHCRDIICLIFSETPGIQYVFFYA